MGFTVSHGGRTATVCEAPAVEVTFNGRCVRVSRRCVTWRTRCGVVRSGSGSRERAAAERRIRVERRMRALANRICARRGAFELGLDEPHPLGMAARTSRRCDASSSGLGDVWRSVPRRLPRHRQARAPATRCPRCRPAGRRAGGVLPLLRPDPDPRRHRRPRAGGPNQRRGRRGARRHRTACQRGGLGLRRVHCGRQALLRGERTAAPSRRETDHRRGRGGGAARRR